MEDFWAIQEALINNVNIFVYGYNPEFNNWAIKDVNTDANGNFEVEVPTGIYTLIFTHNDYWLTRKEYVVVFEDESITLEAKMDTKPSNYSVLTGSVIDADTKEPISDVWISIKNLERNQWFYSSTDTQGIYSIDIPPGEYEIVKRKNDYWPNREVVTVGEGSTTIFDSELKLINYTTLTGTITDAETGEPIEGVWIDALSYGNWFSNTKSNSDGTYSLPIGIGTDFTILVRDEYQEYSVSFKQNIEIKEGIVNILDFELNKISQATISGYVIDSETQDPVHGAVVTLLFDFEVYSYTVRVLTNENGYYEFSNTDIEEESQISITANKYGYQGSSYEGITILDGGFYDFDFQLTTALTDPSGPTDPSDPTDPVPGDIAGQRDRPLVSFGTPELSNKNYNR